MKLGLLFLIFLFLASLPARAETIDVFDNHGGLSQNFIWMSAPDVYQYFNKC